LLRLALMAALVAAPVAIAASRPSTAAKRTCTCASILSTGNCTEWKDCHDVLESADSFRPVRSVRDCRRSQVLLCDDNSCKLVCKTPNKPKL
jgi:hypothetical protein